MTPTKNDIYISRQVKKNEKKKKKKNGCKKVKNRQIEESLQIDQVSDIVLEQ